MFVFQSSIIMKGSKGDIIVLRRDVNCLLSLLVIMFVFQSSKIKKGSKGDIIVLRPACLLYSVITCYNVCLSVQ